MDSSIAREISNQLRTDIQAGRLPPGAVLHQEKLAVRFAVSRQPVRMALELLRTSGHVIARKDRSVEVSGLTDRELEDLLQVRRLLEREALSLAVPRLTERDLLEARQIQERFDLETDPAVLENLDCAFHTALYRPGGNARLLRLIDELRRENRRPFHDQPIGSPQWKRWRREHERLLARCQQRDIAGALAALGDHLKP